MKRIKYLSGLVITLLFSPVACIQSNKKLSGGIVYLENITNRKDQQALQQVIEKGNAVVDFYADWCRPCNQLSTIMNQVAREFPNITFIKVNIENFPMIRSHYNVKGIPALFYFKNGKLINRSVGLMSKNKFADKLKFLYS
ncbi:MAG: thioredoxin family protein [Candidatus Babeliales bacterium]